MTDNLNAVVADMLALPGGDDLTHGLFYESQFFKRMADKIDHFFIEGGYVKIPFQFAKHTVSRSTNPVFTGATSVKDKFRGFTFEADHFAASDLISEIELEQSSGKNAANILKATVLGLKGSIKDQVSIDMMTGDGVGGNYAGVPSIWTTTTTYGGNARPTKATPGNFSYHIAATAAFDVDGGTYGLSDFGGTGDNVARYETRWDFSGVSAAASDCESKNELVAKSLSRLYGHVTDSGDRAEDIIIIVADDVHNSLLMFQNKRTTASDWGVSKSVTASGSTAGGLLMYGSVIEKDKNLTAGEAFILNLKYLHYGTVNGSTPQKVDIHVGKREDLVKTQMASGTVSLVFCCTNGTRQGWAQGLNSLAA